MNSHRIIKNPGDFWGKCPALSIMYREEVVGTAFDQLKEMCIMSAVIFNCVAWKISNRLNACEHSLDDAFHLSRFIKLIEQEDVLPLIKHTTYVSHSGQSKHHTLSIRTEEKEKLFKLPQHMTADYEFPFPIHIFETSIGKLRLGEDVLKYNMPE
jgi:hypothetical protein